MAEKKAAGKDEKAAAGKAEAQRQKAVDLAVTQIEKQFGQGSIMRLGDERSRTAIPVTISDSFAYRMTASRTPGSSM